MPEFLDHLEVMIGGAILTIIGILLKMTSAIETWKQKRLETRRKRAEAKEAEAKEQLAENNALMVELIAIRERVARLEDKVDHLEVINTTLAKEKRELAIELNQTRGENRELFYELKKSREKVKSLEQENEDLRNRLSAEKAKKSAS